jgi:hypothetical protein
MTRKFSMRVALLGGWTLLLAPTAGSANQLNINTVTPARPQIHLNPSLHMDVRSRDVYDLDLSNDCRPDERLKTLKRKRRCRLDR